MTKKGVFGIRDVEACMNQFVEKILSHLTMIRKIVMMSDVIGDDSLAANDRECWNTGHAERVEVIAAQKDDDVRLGLVQMFPR